MCDRPLELDPISTDAYLCKCNGLMGLRREKEALECYNKAIEIDPNAVQARVNKGNILFKLDREDEAMEALHQTKKGFKI
jgi:tetratricopeptide (TPR) repeat protein